MGLRTPGYYIFSLHFRNHPMGFESMSAELNIEGIVSRRMVSLSILKSVYITSRFLRHYFFINMLLTFSPFSCFFRLFRRLSGRWRRDTLPLQWKYPAAEACLY